MSGGKTLHRKTVLKGIMLFGLALTFLSCEALAAAPTVTAISPATSPSNLTTTVNITGSGFFNGGGSQNVSSVKINNVSLSLTNATYTDTTINGAVIPVCLSLIHI